MLQVWQEHRCLTLHSSFFCLFFFFSSSRWLNVKTSLDQSVSDLTLGKNRCFTRRRTFTFTETHPPPCPCALFYFNTVPFTPADKTNWTLCVSVVFCESDPTLREKPSQESELTRSCCDLSRSQLCTCPKTSRLRIILLETCPTWSSFTDRKTLQKLKSTFFSLIIRKNVLVILNLIHI